MRQNWRCGSRWIERTYRGRGYEHKRPVATSGTWARKRKHISDKKHAHPHGSEAPFQRNSFPMPASQQSLFTRNAIKHADKQSRARQQHLTEDNSKRRSTSRSAAGMQGGRGGEPSVVSGIDMCIDARLAAHVVNARRDRKGGAW